MLLTFVIPVFLSGKLHFFQFPYLRVVFFRAATILHEVAFSSFQTFESLA